MRDRTAARNLAVLRKIALNLISRDQASKTSKRAEKTSRLERQIHASVTPHIAPNQTINLMRCLWREWPTLSGSLLGGSAVRPQI